MSRIKKGGNSKVTDGALEGASPITTLPQISGSSAYAKPYDQGQLIQASKTGLVTSPFGQAYMIRRTKPIPADAVQAVSEQWLFDISGVRNWVGNSAVMLPGALDGYTLLTDWYNYARQMGKASLKYKHTPTSLIDTGNVREFFNIAFYAVANLTVFFNMDRLYQYNQAFATLYTYLPERMSRAKRLWRRLSTIFLPTALKQYAMKCGMIPEVSGVFPAWIRLWSEFSLGPYGGAADYVALTAHTPNQIFIDATHSNDILDNIEKAIWALEGNISDATDLADFIAIKDMIDMLNDVVPGLFTQGLPEPASFPGVLADRSLYNDLFCRGLLSLDGGNQDIYDAFPFAGCTALNSRVPVIGWGTPSVEEFCLLGGMKLCGLNDTPNTGSTAKANKVLVYGTSSPVILDNRTVDLYTREDGWVTVNAGDVDLNDGTAIRTLLNTGHPISKHKFFLAAFGDLLGAGMELRFLDTLDVDYQIYVDEEDICPNYALLLGSWLGVPYLK